LNHTFAGVADLASLLATGAVLGAVLASVLATGAVLGAVLASLLATGAVLGAVLASVLATGAVLGTALAAGAGEVLAAAVVAWFYIRTELYVHGQLRNHTFGEPGA